MNTHTHAYYSKRVKTFNRLWNLSQRLAIIIVPLLSLIVFNGCTPNGQATFKDYTGHAPNGAMGTIMHIAKHPGYKGIEVTLTVSSFGDVENVSDQKDADKVTTELVKYATLYNEASWFKGVQYYYIYWPKKFRPGRFCEITLYYLVPPLEANENLRFKFDYPDKKILVDKPCNLNFRDNSTTADGASSIQYGATMINISDPSVTNTRSGTLRSVTP